MCIIQATGRIVSKLDVDERCKTRSICIMLPELGTEQGVEVKVTGVRVACRICTAG
jgi:hypothetical protein